MSPSRQSASRVIALHPTARGFGWTVFEAPLSPIDWGLAKAGKERNAKLVRRFERICNRYEPAVLVLEDFEDEKFKRSERIKALCREIMHLAACRRMQAHVLRRSFVQSTFAEFGAHTRYEIGEYIREKIDALSPHTPRRRKIWSNADLRQNLFDAAALAFTYFAILDAEQNLSTRR